MNVYNFGALRFLRIASTFYSIACIEEDISQLDHIKANIDFIFFLNPISGEI